MNRGYEVGSNQSSSVDGQTSEQQRAMIEDFNHGIVKILVATSVAEEGLDISACNLIIKYNNAGSERTLIQRREAESEVFELYEHFNYLHFDSSYYALTGNEF
ncbi:unnamed protein product [Gongylonema pulchrum]|uniref:Helicase C-terminal domain-containing protein n=1 Tax=Gongylonema pulchrum TaxID=637853 RepID=A0A183EZY2_9BILA|nr:unnamed protein product [Gongylonema pulchrum]